MEFGYKAQFTDNVDWIVLDSSAHQGNPADAPLLAPAIARVKAVFGKAPGRSDRRPRLRRSQNRRDVEPVELLATALKVPGAISEGLEAATFPAPLTTSKTDDADDADDADVTNELSATESLSDETPYTQTNLVREREKAEPGTLDDGDETTTDSEGVGTENDSDAEAASEPQQSEVGNAESDDHADDSGDGDTAAKP